jgi:hypothetical protein
MPMNYFNNLSPDTPTTSIFPSDPETGQITITKRKDLYVYDGDLWLFVGGEHVSGEFYSVVVSHVRKIDFIYEPLLVIKADLDLLLGESSLAIGNAERIFLENIVFVKKKIDKRRGN